MERTKFHIKDFGCKVNQYDSRLIREALQSMGHVFSGLPDADIVLVNTCSVTKKADKKALKYIRRTKREFPNKEIMATGCSVRKSSSVYHKSGAETAKSFLWLDNPSRCIRQFYDHTRAFIKVQQGCSGGCSYCSIWKLKRPFFKKKPETVIKEIKKVSQKHPEIVLCATNFKEYGYLDELVKKMVRLKGDLRWRFSSIHPLCLRKNIIELLEEDDRFCPHFHFPIQSASDSVLKRMNRNYSIVMIRRIIDDIKINVENAVFSFDLIAGFPGETCEDFNKTIGFIKDVSPVKVHVFPFSPRNNTPAYKMGGRVMQNIKNYRVRRIQEAAHEERLKNFREWVGKKAEVILENGKSGYTRESLPVKIKGSPSFYGKHADVRISGFTDKCLTGYLE